MNRTMTRTLIERMTNTTPGAPPFRRTRRAPLRAALPVPAILLLLLAALSPGCSGKGGAGAGFSMPPMPAEVADVVAGKIEENFQAVGTIEADEAVTIVAEVDGIVTSVPFREGGKLSKGGLIASLDDLQVAAEVSRTEALYAQSRATYDRVKSVVDQGAGAPQDLDDAAAALKVAEANLALAKARHAKTRITAPFDGTAGSRRISVGSYIRAGQAITDLANLSRIRVIFSAPERMIAQIKEDAEVIVSSTAFPGYSARGKIIVVEPTVDQVTRTTRVVAVVPNKEGKFRSGMSADITALLSVRPQAVIVPSEAVFAAGDQSFVFAVKADSTVARTPISLGTRTADVVEVLSGLTPGMKVVRAGHQKLFDGAKVMPIPPGGMPGGPGGPGGTPGAAPGGGSPGEKKPAGKTAGGGKSEKGTKP
jgi:membrane fusion protein (multidrug efflux system)